jgi:Protein of unknown function (DUF1592)/Protein of unknown function (DUF1588)/Protein of unknown function (DUF1595)/Protein of unknown function (DUF1585)/Protein of unknown function (DUF1587)
MNDSVIPTMTARLGTVLALLTLASCSGGGGSDETPDGGAGMPGVGSGDAPGTVAGNGSGSGNGAVGGNGNPGAGNGSGATGNGGSGSGAAPANGGGDPLGTGGTLVDPGPPPEPLPRDDQGRVVCEGTTGATAQVRRLTAPEYSNIVRDVFGISASQQYPGSYGVSASGYSTEPALTTISEQGVELVMYAAEEIAREIPARLPELLPCSVSNANDNCAVTYLDTVGRRAFRRTMVPEERDNLLATYAAQRSSGASFSDAVAVMTAHMLQMPGFLYVMEMESESGEDRLLTGVELATRLALHFWNSVPDDRLLDLADRGELSTREQVEAEAERLFEDPRSNRGFARFLREWTQTTQLLPPSKDPSAFPFLDDGVAASVNESFDRFVSDQMRTGTVTSLLTSNQAYVNQDVAPILGVSASGSGWTQAELDGSRYAGIMTQPAMMAALSHATEPSYVFRGKFILKRLLCVNIGAPPANAMSAFAELEKPANPTAKELSAVVGARGECAGCHGLMDPGGLAFEHFDAMGQYREQYASGKAIDTTGTLNPIVADAFDFEGPSDLMESLAAMPATRQCFAQQVFRYTMSRLNDPNTLSDACTVQAIDDQLVASDGRLDSAFRAVATTDAFRYRRGE